MSRLTRVHVTVTIAARAGAVGRPWVAVETTGTPEGAERGVRRAAGADRGEFCCSHLSQLLPACPSWHRSHTTFPDPSSTQVGLKLRKGSVLSTSHNGHGCSPCRGMKIRGGEASFSTCWTGLSEDKDTTGSRLLSPLWRCHRNRGDTAHSEGRWCYAYNPVGRTDGRTDGVTDGSPDC